MGKNVCAPFPGGGHEAEAPESGGISVPNRLSLSQPERRGYVACDDEKERAEVVLRKHAAGARPWIGISGVLVMETRDRAADIVTVFMPGFGHSRSPLRFGPFRQVNRRLQYATEALVLFCFHQLINFLFFVVVCFPDFMKNPRPVSEMRSGSRPPELLHTWIPQTSSTPHAHSPRRLQHPTHS
jgi:hypothetical protein